MAIAEHIVLEPLLGGEQQGSKRPGTVFGTVFGSVHREIDLLYAARLVSAGEVIGVFNRGVNALWINGGNESAVAKLHEIKGEGRNGRPVALTIGFETFPHIIDTSSMPPEVQDFLSLSRDLKRELGSLCFIRAPLQTQYAGIIPRSSLSYDLKNRPWVQTWDPHGHKPTEDLINKIMVNGIDFPAVTSMNISGRPEIVDQDEGFRFCQTAQIPMFLNDDRARADLKGSYTIITLGEKGVELARDGNIPGSVLQEILGIPLIRDETRGPNYPQLEFPPHLTDGLSSKGARIAVLLFLEGKDPMQINKALRETEGYSGNV